MSYGCAPLFALCITSMSVRVFLFVVGVCGSPITGERTLGSVLLLAFVCLADSLGGLLRVALFRSSIHLLAGTRHLLTHALFQRCSVP